jgi:hypothetical protein
MHMAPCIPAEIPFPDVPGDMSFEAQDLITKLLRPNPRQRPSVDQIKVMPDHNRQMMHTHNARVSGCCTSQMCRTLHGEGTQDAPSAGSCLMFFQVSSLASEQMALHG